jgi:hypothetical protein
VQPSAVHLAAANALGAKVEWNTLGAPASTSQANLLDEDWATVWNSTGAAFVGRRVVVGVAGAAPVALR